MNAVPGAIDLAVIAVPAATVPTVVAECADHDVRGLVDHVRRIRRARQRTDRAAGAQAQRDLVAAARSNGMRVVGPNCLGIVNTDPAVRLNASLAPVPPLTGRAGFFCQSGALGVAILGEAARRGLGVSTFVSAGNRADVSGNDLLQFWETDERTDVVLMYLESFGNPRKFARLARRLGRRKPIVAVNSGAGAVVPGLASTSASLPDEAARALFERSGVIRVDTVSDLFDVALLLTSQPLPPGDRIAVVGNSTALGLLVTNACAAEGLSLARLEDVGVDAAPDELERVLRGTLEDESVDAAVVVFAPPLQRRADEVATCCVRSARRRRSRWSRRSSACRACRINWPPREPPCRLAGRCRRTHRPSGQCARSREPVRYAAWRREPAGTVPVPEGMELSAARVLTDAVLAEHPDGAELSPPEAERLLGTVGIVAVSRDAAGRGGGGRRRPRRSVLRRARVLRHRRAWRSNCSVTGPMRPCRSRQPTPSNWCERRAHSLCSQAIRALRRRTSSR